ncbi:MAG: hypothetical protein DI610_04900, partial [Staphylococcus hominis]
MISKKIKYTDYNDNTVEETFHFHLNKAELTKMNFTEDGNSLVDMISEITEDNAGTRRVLNILEDIVRAAVGEKSEDGSRFIKNDDIRSKLFDTEAYSELFTDLLQHPERTAKFIQGILPKESQKEINKALNGDDVTNLSREELIARIHA